jgi:hypothetical protein
MTFGDDIPSNQVFESPAGFVKYDGMKPGDDKFKQPEPGNKDWLKTRFSLVIGLNPSDPEHVAFMNNAAIVDAAVQARVAQEPSAFVSLDAATRKLAKEVQEAVVASKHFRLVDAGAPKDEEKPEEGNWDPTTGFKADGWAGVCKKLNWETKKTKKGDKDMIKSIEWAVREVGVAGSPSPAPDACKILYVWKIDKNGKRHDIDQLPMLDDNGAQLTRTVNGVEVDRMRYVGPQDLVPYGTRAVVLFGMNRLWCSTTGYGVSKNVKSAIYVIPGKPRNSTKSASAKSTKITAESLAESKAAMLAARGAAEEGSDDEQEQASSEFVNEDEYASAAAAATTTGDDTTVEALDTTAAEAAEDTAAADAAAKAAEEAAAKAAKAAAKAAKAAKEGSTKRKADDSGDGKSKKPKHSEE